MTMALGIAIVASVPSVATRTDMMITETLSQVERKPSYLLVATAVKTETRTSEKAVMGCTTARIVLIPQSASTCLHCGMK